MKTVRYKLLFREKYRYRIVSSKEYQTINTSVKWAVQGLYFTLPYLTLPCVEQNFILNVA